MWLATDSVCTLFIYSCLAAINMEHNYTILTGNVKIEWSIQGFRHPCGCNAYFIAVLSSVPFSYRVLQVFTKYKIYRNALKRYSICCCCGITFCTKPTTAMNFCISSYAMSTSQFIFTVSKDLISMLRLDDWCKTPSKYFKKQFRMKIFSWKSCQGEK